MKVIFDPAKDAANRDKHGVPLAKAVELEWDSMQWLSWIAPKVGASSACARRIDAR